MPFCDIAGHQRLLPLLARAIARDTLPPAALFAGPAGVGKRRVAGAVAQALNCLAPVTTGAFAVDACGTCAACRRIARGVHPDAIVLEPGESGSIKIEQVRDVIDRAGYRPFEGRRRAVIVDEADALVPAAQSALLKTLEEPRPASVFMLISSMPDALLPTVRSRCPVLRFGALAPSEVAAVLMRDHEYADAEAHAAAAEADGSVGRALAAQSIDLRDARAAATHLLDQMARGADPARRLDAARALTPKAPSPAVERDRLAVCLRALSSLLRDLDVIATGADTRVLANADLEGELRRLSGAFDDGRSRRAFVATGQALAALERNAGPKVVADWLVLQL